MKKKMCKNCMKIPEGVTYSNWNIKKKRMRDWN